MEILLNGAKDFLLFVHIKVISKTTHLTFSGIKLTPTPKLFDFINRDQRMGEEYYLSKESKYYHIIDQLAQKNDYDRLFQIRRVEGRACSQGVCPTLTANMGGGGHNVPFVFDKFGLRRLTEQECLKLQGFEPNKVKVPDHVFPKDLYKMVGNAVSVNTVSAIIEEIQIQLLSKIRDENDSEKRVAFPA